MLRQRSHAITRLWTADSIAMPVAAVKLRGAEACRELKRWSG